MSPRWKLITWMRVPLWDCRSFKVFITLLNNGIIMHLTGNKLVLFGDQGDHRILIMDVIQHKVAEQFFHKFFFFAFSL